MLGCFGGVGAGGWDRGAILKQRTEKRRRIEETNIEQRHVSIRTKTVGTQRIAAGSRTNTEDQALEFLEFRPLEEPRDNSRILSIINNIHLPIVFLFSRCSNPIPFNRYQGSNLGAVRNYFVKMMPRFDGIDDANWWLIK